jgi:hypothetical protein
MVDQFNYGYNVDKGLFDDHYFSKGKNNDVDKICAFHGTTNNISINLN